MLEIFAKRVGGLICLQLSAHVTLSGPESTDRVGAAGRQPVPQSRCEIVDCSGHGRDSGLRPRSEAYMWRMKSESVMEEYSRDVRANVERFYVENDDGVRITLRGLVGRVEEGVERLEYADGNIKFVFTATRIDPARRKLASYYTVYLGSALQGASYRLPPGILTITRARKIARDIKEALSVWLVPGRIKEIIGATTPATDVRFVMNDWQKWDPTLEKDWP